MSRDLGYFESTAYGPPWVGIQGTGVSATGIDLRDGKPHYIVAVDPDVIALHSYLQITPNPFSDVVIFRAEDTGGDIQGHRLDFYDWRGRRTQLAWGRQRVRVFAVNATQHGRPAPPRAPGVATAPPMPDAQGHVQAGGESRTDYSPYVHAAARHVGDSMRHVHGVASMIRHLPRARGG